MQLGRYLGASRARSGQRRTDEMVRLWYTECELRTIEVMLFSFHFSTNKYT